MRMTNFVATKTTDNDIVLLQLDSDMKMTIGFVSSLGGWGWWRWWLWFGVPFGWGVVVGGAQFEPLVLRMSLDLVTKSKTNHHRHREVAAG